MGQKVNPIGFRLKVTNNWSSLWYANKRSYTLYVLEDVIIRNYVNNNFARAMVGKVVIKRKSGLVEVIIYSARPGMIIGKKGADINNVKNKLQKLISKEVKIDILEIKVAESNAVLIANNISHQIQKRVSYRKTIKRAIKSALSYGVKGIRITCSGRLNGAEIARTEWHKEGRIPLHTLRADIEYACSEVKMTYGIIGTKVWVYKGDNKDYL